MIKTEGFDKLKKTMDRLPHEVRQEASRKAVRFSLKPVEEAAKRRLVRQVDMRTMNLLRSIGIKVRKAQRNKPVVGSVMTRTSGKNKGYHGHLIEFGTSSHKIGKLKHPGSKAFPFLGPSFVAKEGQVIQRLRKSLVRKMQIEWRKL